jgi:YHS domain-containing protein
MFIKVAGRPQGGAAEEAETELLARDPVCGRDVVVTRSPASSDYAGVTYYFCSFECQQDFNRQPERYVPAAEAEA